MLPADHRMIGQRLTFAPEVTGGARQSADSLDSRPVLDNNPALLKSFQ
jgi:hypothetical protein